MWRVMPPRAARDSSGSAATASPSRCPLLPVATTSRGCRPTASGSPSTCIRHTCRSGSTGTADGGPQLSPDGHWLAYASDESGRGREIYVRAFPGPGGPWQVSDGGGNEPQWNPRGGELFYRTGSRMMAVPVDTTAGFSAGKPHELFRGDYLPSWSGYVRANYDVSPDGQRFLMKACAT